MLEIRLLGQFAVRLDDEPVDIPSRPAQSLLAYLVLRPGISHRREKIAGLLWPDSEEGNARSYLRHALWRIRKVLGDGYLQADKLAISFPSDVEFWVDALQLEREASPDSIHELKEIASVYGGELLPGFYDDWTVLDRERYRAQFEKNAQAYLEGLLKSEHWGEALEWGERWIALGGAPEQAYRGLMLANTGLGDASGVAAAFERCQEALNDLGVEISAQTRELFSDLSKGMDPRTALTAAPLPASVEKDEQAIRRLLAKYLKRDAAVLDVPALAIVNASPAELTFNQEETALLIRSALHHDLDVDPWVERSNSSEFAVTSLHDLYDAYPRPRVRLRIVEALSQLPENESLQSLFHIASNDDSGEVRSQAALAVAAKGRHAEIMSGLNDKLQNDREASVLAAFVTVADRYGIPDGLKGYPTLPVGLSLIQKRWQNARSFLMRRTWKTALSGGLSMAILQVLLFISVLLTPEKFQDILEVVSLPAWIFINIVTGLVWGGLFGAGIGFLISLADEVIAREAGMMPRRIAGGVAGLFHAGFILFTASATGTWASVSPQIYLPVYLVYGVITGALLSFLIPKSSEHWSAKQSGLRLGLVSLSILAVSTVAVWIAYGMQFEAENAIPDLQAFILLSILYPAGLLLGIRGDLAGGT